MSKTHNRSVRFDEILERVKRPIVLEDAVEYACVGVRLYGQGAYVRESKLGGTISRKQQWLVRTDDVIYNKLFAWKGTFAMANATVDGCIASDKFPTYRHDPTLVRRDYLQLWFKSSMLAAQAEAYSKGAAALSKLTLNPPDFWKLTIPLPSIDEQEAIARKAASLLGLVTSVEQLRTPLDAVIHGRRAGIGSHVRLVLDFALSELNSAFQDNLGVLDEVLVMRPRSGPSFVVSEEGSGIAVVMPSATLGYRLNRQKVLYGLGTEGVRPKDILEDQDLLITRGNYRDQVGICVVYGDDSIRRTYANLIMRMKVDESAVLPEFVKYWIMSPLCVQYIRQHTKGTSPSVQKINQRSLIAMPFPRGIDLAVQTEWVHRLNGLFDDVERLETAIREQYALISGLQEIVLTAAFDGRLLDDDADAYRGARALVAS